MVAGPWVYAHEVAEPTRGRYTPGADAGRSLWRAIRITDRVFVNARKIVEPELRREVSIVTHAHRAQSYATRRVAAAIKSVVADLYSSKRWRGELMFELESESDGD